MCCVVAVVLIKRINTKFTHINHLQLQLYMAIIVLNIVSFAKRMSLDLRHVSNTRDDNWLEMLSR